MCNVSNVAVLLKHTIFRGTFKLIQHIGAHEPLCFHGVVAHDEMFWLGALVIYVYFELLCVFFAGDVFFLTRCLSICSSLS